MMMTAVSLSTAVPFSLSLTMVDPVLKDRLLAKSTVSVKEKKTGGRRHYGHQNFFPFMGSSILFERF